MFNKELNKYIQNGLSIDGNPKDGYEIFTIPTQHFHIKTLDELTADRFEEEIKVQQEISDMETEMLTYYGVDNILEIDSETQTKMGR